MLIRYCDGIMEAIWLTALVSIPLFFSVWGEALQAEKSYLLRSLAIMLLTAWVIKCVSRVGCPENRPDPKRLRLLAITPLVAPTVIIVLGCVTATVHS